MAKIFRIAKRPDIFQEYARKGGPLPKRHVGSIGEAFWRAYEGGPSQGGLRGGHKGSLADRAFQAGLKRLRVEPGLTTQSGAQ